MKGHVEYAFYQATHNTCTNKMAGIALPKHSFYQKWIDPILPALKVLEIELFWILPDGNIEALGHWKNTNSKRMR